jgi:hypothetical protein
LGAPAYPPSPDERNFPFHESDGSHTSKLMFESLVGLLTPTTRQKAGRRVNGCFADGVNDPVVMTSAVVIVVFASKVNLVNAAQAPPADGGVDCAVSFAVIVSSAAAVAAARNPNPTNR